MNKILVIGGAGYIGSHVTYKLCDQGYKVIVLDNLRTGFVDNIDKRSDFINHSFTNQHVINKVLKDVDCVIHLAALKAAGESMSSPVEYSKHNINDSINLINSCLENNVKNFIFSSSAAVYGFPQYLPVDEKHDLNPINYYGFTKLIIEKQLLWYYQLKGLNVACLRYFNAAGYDVKGRVKNKEKNPQNLLPVVMEVAAGLREKIDVFGNDYDTPDGTCLRDYIHVNDLASAHVSSIDYLNNNERPLVVNLSTGNAFSVFDVIKEAEIVTGRKVKYDIVEKRLGDPAELYSKSLKANKLLNWIPKYSDLNIIIKSMWDIYK